MATFVQVKTRTVNSSPATTVAITTTQGSLIVLVVGTANASASPPSITVSDSKNNTWIAGPSVFISGSLPTLNLFYAVDINGGTSHTFTVTTAATQPFNFVVEEWSGMGTCSIDQTATTTDTTGTTTNCVTGTTLVTSYTTELVIAAYANQSANSFTATGSYTNMQNISDIAPTFNVGVESLVTTAPAAITGTATQPSGSKYVGLVATFTTRPFQQMNNYQFVKVGDGMSVSERIR